MAACKQYVFTAPRQVNLELLCQLFDTEGNHLCQIALESLSSYVWMGYRISFAITSGNLES